ncbi:lipid II flippase FtsW [Caedimonas varicaedens]|jgi:cell division protein FtsW|uniref:Probable peptidoglycan glycosyltransferase FtsW n=1 Tax=Caedimonas varicaedens TaxID=1629334 RepID=A0A0K8MFY3_9PROT|nr:lipid II flippase FtsW [Caedimonas varicaedens]
MTAFARTDNSKLGRWWWTVDRWTLAAIFLLIAIGFLLTMAASPSVAHRLKLESFYFVKRHAIYMIPVVFILISVSLLNLRDTRRLAMMVYGVGILMLLFTLFMGVDIKGARRWISILGFSLQPSEFVKPALAVLCAWMLAENQLNPVFPGKALALMLYGLTLCLLILQPDMGMAVLVSVVFFCQFFLAGLPLLWVALGVLTGAVGSISAYFFLPHVTQRVDRFLKAEGGDKYTDQYQITQSLDAFVNGGVFGQGPGEGTVKKHLPDAHADFIFAVAGEEFGLILCLIIVGLFAFIVLRNVGKVIQENDFFIVLAVSGLIIEFGLQAIINMSSTLSLIPTKGMTLPFISYGGSSMMALALTMGMVLALTRRRTRVGINL